MCGIAGLFDLTGRLSPERLGMAARSMAAALRHRGPDGEGIWTSPDGRCVLAHRRLSIIDPTSGGAQPMTSADGRHVITFNGELYNYPDLKSDLEAAGMSFRTRSDTEVLLSGLARYGADFLTRCDAMFALGWYQQDERRLTLARDAFGEKPLYYFATADVFAFASELHALALAPGFDPTIDIDELAGYLTFQYVPAPQAIYRNCRKLEPGSILTVEPGRVGAPVRYFSFETSGERTGTASLDELADELEELLVRALKGRLLSDVPLGAFLSGGIDSSTVAALITRKLNRSLKTFSIGFSGDVDSEHNDARAIANHLGTDHHERLISPDQTDMVELLAQRLDEPNADSSCLPTYLLSSFARESVTVALSGDGGDEMFGGYGRYFDSVAATAANRDRILAGTWTTGRDYYSGRILIFEDRGLRALMGEAPDPMPNLLWRLREAINQDSRPFINVFRELDSQNYLPGAVLAKVDRMSMQHSLEVRTPFLSIDVARFAARLPEDRIAVGRQGKLVLRRVAERLLPPDWLARPKKGFGMPVAGWGEATMRPVVDRLLASSDCRLAEWIPRAQFDLYRQGSIGNSSFYQLWAVALLEHWLRTHPSLCGRARMPEPVPAAAG
ncbi:asparagine synthase (glutamine-hydrolyzing) [Azospirillum endophyticum]